MTDTHPRTAKINAPRSNKIKSDKIRSDRPRTGSIKTSAERGNVFFYIFIAVALFGGLTLAVSQGGRVSGESLSREQTQLRATELIDYSDTISKAVGLLRLRGVALADLRFAASDLPTIDYGDPALIEKTHMVFNPEGGSVLYKNASSDIVSSGTGQYEFVGLNAIDGFGTTCATDICSDLVMVLPNVRDAVCRAVNVYGDTAPTSNTIPNDSAFLLSGKFMGIIAGPSEILGDEASSSILSGKPYGCFTNDADGENYFYRVLWVR